MNSLTDMAHTDKIFKDKPFLKGGNLARLNGFISLSKWVDILGHLGTDVEALSCSLSASQEGSAPANEGQREPRASCLIQVFLRKKVTCKSLIRSAINTGKRCYCV